MNKFFLDTNIIIYYIKGTNPNIKEHFECIPRQSILIPSVVCGEIEYGARKSSSYEKTITLYSKFLSNFKQIPFDSGASKYYGIIRSDLEKRGEMIGPNDMMIASIVMANNGILVTNNTKEFSRINDLEIVNWIG